MIVFEAHFQAIQNYSAVIQKYSTLTHNPLGLLNKVFFEVTLFFCRRGMENLYP